MGKIFPVMLKTLSTIQVRLVEVKLRPLLAVDVEEKMFLMTPIPKLTSFSAISGDWRPGNISTNSKQLTPISAQILTVIPIQILPILIFQANLDLFFPSL